MNPESLDANAIRRSSIQVAQAGRENLILLLRHLRVIERQRLFSAWGFQSLFHYVTTELKFSEQEAQRRISTMRLMRDVPSILEGLRDGSLSMTNLCQAQTLFLKEKKAGRKYSPLQKADIVEVVRGKSSREAMRILSEVNPEMKRTRELTFDSIENEELRQRLIEVRGLYAHVDPNMSLEDLLLRMADNELGVKSRRRDAQPSTSMAKSNTHDTPLSAVENLPSAPKVDSEAEIRRKVWQRHGGKCTKCDSTHAVQEEHIVPVGAGGKTTLENMTLLCKNCNLRAAMDYYGIKKMKQYVRDVERPYLISPRSRRGFRAKPILAAIIEWEKPPALQRSMAS